MLREGHRRSAYRWFQRVAEEHPETALQQEASYLAALALPDSEREAKEAAFQQATADTDQSLPPAPVPPMGVYAAELGR